MKGHSSAAALAAAQRRLGGSLGPGGAAWLSSSAGDGAKPGFEQLVGNTRMVRLKFASELTGCDVLAKCEYENPGGSIKDRAALWMIRDAEARGLLKRGEPGVVVEGTAGNTGIGLALASRVFGYRCIIGIASSQSEEKKATLRLAGASLVEVPPVPYKNPNNYVHVAKRLAAEIKEQTGLNTLYADQWDNLANRRAHTESTGPEIYEQAMAMTGRLDAFSCAMGTGGTLSGVAEYLRSKHPSIKIGLTDPCGAAVYRYFRDGQLASEGSSITEGIGQGRITGNMEGFTPDLLHEIPDTEMMPTLYALLEKEGLAVGGSAAVNVAGAIRVAKDLGPGHTVVTPLCDLGQRYASKLYNPSFLASKGLPVAPWLQDQSFQEDLDPDFFNALHEATIKATAPADA
ncbi:Cysteine synthase [Hondaea fermentalgiana]|uniref:Cysteine synthase 1 n=1 Tax=Hondaea fermentalgiana TaxID=2315210 RepID=A0A2R5GQI6_9STRA|nr:Cysteine synthase [Hondaea fermentalgiana]|eukprot:GBG32875.1 Cysteine synthase [Hondaea fermentalgiana]